MDSFQEKYNALVIKYNALLAENEELKSILSQHGIVYSTIKCADESTAFSSIIYPPIKLSIDKKIALFRNFFKGRDDVFARRWFNKTTEKSGYQPVCINEWRRGICDKKKHKCAECPNRNFVPLTNQDIYRHLEGKDENGCDVIGLYVVLLIINVFSCVLILMTRIALMDIRTMCWHLLPFAESGESHSV